MTFAGQAVLTDAVPTVRELSAELEAVVRTHARFVYRVAYSVLRNHHDAEDATQETFLRVWRHQCDLADVRDLRAWLARIAWRAARRRRRPVVEVSLEDAARGVLELRDRGHSAEEIAADQQMAALLERLIASLPGKLRDVLTLSTVEEMTAAEIAAVLGIPEASVRTRLFRARQMLREKLSVLVEGRNAR